MLQKTRPVQIHVHVDTFDIVGHLYMWYLFCQAYVHVHVQLLSRDRWLAWPHHDRFFRVHVHIHVHTHTYMYTPNPEPCTAYLTVTAPVQLRQAFSFCARHITQWNLTSLDTVGTRESSLIQCTQSEHLEH